jgi:Fur family ferric uptake transcriptional regulator
VLNTKDSDSQASGPDQNGIQMENENKFAWFWEKLDAYLTKHQLKQTTQRRQIVEIFLNSQSHIDAEALHAKVRKHGLNIGLATIYRTLNLLRDAKLVEQRDFAEGRAVFEPLSPLEHHDHLICQDCGQIQEFENHEIEELQRQVAKRLGFELKSHRLDLFGRCLKSNCPNKKTT